MKPAVSLPPDTRQRLLDAAARVFARDGLAGATTRAIAQDAGVNEVTLFRHFQTKDRLITAVVGENFGAKSTTGQTDIPAPTDDFRADLLLLCQRYQTLLSNNWPLVRTMLGEMHHHLTETHEKQVFRAIFRPLKEAIQHRIETAQRESHIKSEPGPDMLSDILLGSIFTGVLRRSLPHLKIDYSAAQYVESAVALFLEGASTRKSG